MPRQMPSSGFFSAFSRIVSTRPVACSDSIAAGDEENDISMIRAAGLGIAMKNGNPKAQAAADAVTDEDNDHDGLERFLREALT